MKSDVITLTVDLQFAPEKTDQATQLIVSGIGRIEAKSGCQHCLILRDAVSENRVRYSEIWATDDEFQQHVQSEEFRRILAAMDMCSEEPAVTIGKFSGHIGLTYLQQLCDRR